MGVVGEPVEGPLIVAIAEGIETAQEFEVMKELGVPLSQGFFLGRPQPAKQWQVAGAALCTGRES